ncbi:murein biosynthesis integral membrane protein MurJ [Ancylobacter terrae]|uniref:murein biosynthesis integral membrane protein MurJ n=1 Tax=Ancylobacter sp. sgz301288 TaxID=3342077 RepID=UPI00385CAFFE
MSLLRRSSTVTAITLASRLLGVARDAAVAALFGTGAVADASVAGLALPQLARRLLGEGAVNGAVVPPVRAAEAQAGEAAARALAGSALVALVLAAALLALLAALFMPGVVALVAPGFDMDGSRAEGASFIGRLAIVCLPLMAAAGVLSALANASGRVALPAASPLVGNVAVLAVLGGLLLALHAGGAGDRAALVWLGLATIAGALGQLGVALLAVRGGRLSPGLTSPRRWRAALAPASLRAALPILGATAPALLTTALPQLRFIIAGAAASGVVGGVAALFYAGRLIELPLGLVGASAGAVLLPALAGEARGERDASGGAGARGIEAALALTLPAACGLALLAGPVVGVLFRRGAFDAGAAEATTLALVTLAAGVPLQAAEKILAAIAFAHGHARLATRAALLALLAGGITGFATVGSLGIAGPALGLVLSSLIGLTILLTALIGHRLIRLDRAAWRRLGGIAVAALAMSLALLPLRAPVAAMVGAGGIGAWAALGAAVLFGVGVYLAVARLAGGLDIAALKAALKG